MGDALFYHLTRSGAEQLLPQLLGKALGAGWRVELRARAAARLAALDEALWLNDGFLPHGLAGGPHDDRQKVILREADAVALTIPAQCLMILDGAEVTAAEAETSARTCVIFDGNDDKALDRAREQWRILSSAGIAAQYWSEAGGRWEKKR